MGYDTSYDITLMESNISRRIIYFSIMSRNQPGIPVATVAGSVCSIHKGGAAAIASAATLLARDSTNGLYSLTLAQSECSVMGGPGTMVVQVSVASCIPTTAWINIKAVDSGDSMRFGMFALPNAAANASGGLPQKGTVHSDFTSRLDLVSYSGATIGAGNFAPGTYSGVSFEVKSGGIQTTSVGKGAYSGVSVEITTGGIQTVSMGKGNYSGVSQEVLTGGIQPSSIGAGNYSGMSVEVKLKGIATTSVTSGTYSGVTFGANPVGDKTGYGVTSIAAANYSGVSVEILTGGIQTTSVGKGSYSGVSMEVTTGGIQPVSIGAGNYSGMSVEVKTKGIGTNSITSATYSGVSFGANPVGDKTGYSLSGTKTTLDALNDIDGSAVTLHAGTHSNVTLQGLSNYANLPSVTVANGLYSAVTVRVDPQAYSGLTVGLNTSIPTAAEIADSMLSRNLAGGADGGRTVRDALRSLRNKVTIGGSTLTVFAENDSTSAWTASITTADASPIVGIDPGGP